MFKADLHCHSTCSDGTLSPIELLTLAKEEGLSALSITDHDTISAYETATTAAQRLNIRLGTGVEFSSDHSGTSIHVLGYGYLLDAEPIKTLCLKHQKRRTSRNLAILANLKKHEIFIEEKELEQCGRGRTIGRPHIAELMIKKGYVSTVKQAFNRYLADNKRCYVKGEVFTTQETIDVIHQSGGKAFIAHPHLLPKHAPLKELLKLPFDGIECYYAFFKRESVEEWLKIAKAKKWLVSGGSDFHGSIKPGIPLGCSFVDQECFEKIFKHDP